MTDLRCHAWKKALILTLLFWMAAGCAGQGATTSHLPSLGEPPMDDAGAAEVPPTSSHDSNLTTEGLATEGLAPEGLAGEIFPGTGRFLATSRPPQSSQAVREGEGVTLNSVEADVTKVAEAVLGKLLKRDYILAPDVKGPMTLRSRQPIPEDAVLGALEMAFETAGFIMVERGDLLEIEPRNQRRLSGVRPRVAGAGEVATPGYGLVIVPLHYVDVKDIEKVARPLMADGLWLGADKKRNLVFLQGAGFELEVALETLDLFDVNWLQAMSFGLFTLRHAKVEVIVEELASIFRHGDSLMSDQIDLIPLPRMNALLIMTPHAEFIKDVEVWLKRLDRHGDGEDQQIFVYNVQHGTAADITASLLSILGVGGEGAAPASQADGAGGNEAAALGGAFQAGTNGDVRIVANETNNAIMIYASRRTYQMILEAIKQIDVPVDQVLIEATIAEVSLSDQLKYGVQWYFDNAENRFIQSGNGGGSVASQFPGFSYTYFTTSVQVALSALEAVTDVKVLSSPKLLTLNNQTGSLQVGDQVPVASQTAVSISDANAPIVNSVQFRDTGVILEVTPRINSNGMVLMEIAQEVSDVIPTTTPGIDSPTIQQRKIRSTVTVEDGETIALGGLIRESQTKGKSGVPYLSRLPVVGAAFGSQSQTGQRTELLIFLKPRVIRNKSEARLTTEYLREQVRHSKFFSRVE